MMFVGHRSFIAGKKLYFMKNSIHVDHVSDAIMEMIQNYYCRNVEYRRKRLYLNRKSWEENYKGK